MVIKISTHTLQIPLLVLQYLYYNNNYYYTTTIAKNTTNTTTTTIQVAAAEQRCANKEELSTLLGRGRSKQGMFLGNLLEGELEIGQCSAHINNILSAEEIVRTIWNEFEIVKSNPLARKE